MTILVSWEREKFVSFMKVYESWNYHFSFMKVETLGLWKLTSFDWKIFLTIN